MLTAIPNTKSLAALGLIRIMLARMIAGHPVYALPCGSCLLDSSKDDESNRLSTFLNYTSAFHVLEESPSAEVHVDLSVYWSPATLLPSSLNWLGFHGE